MKASTFPSPSRSPSAKPSETLAGVDLFAIARAAIAACAAGPLTEEATRALSIEEPPLLVGAGKAAVAMAAGVARGLGKMRLHGGLVVTKQARGFAPEGVEIRVGAHPEPDARSAAAGRAMVRRLSRASHDRRVIAVLSGGASSLLASPVSGVSLEELRQTTRALIASGLPIHDVNAVRQALTVASGGRLAGFGRAPIDVIVVSDVIGDDLSIIGSGPFAAPVDAARVAAIAAEVPAIPEAVRAVLARPREIVTQTAVVRHHLVASPQTLLAAAVAEAERRGLQVIPLAMATDDVLAVADRLAAVTLAPGQIAIGVGEPTVRLPADHGRGGRNQQLALEMAHRLADGPLVFASVASDGDDGPTDAAGAVVDGESLARLVRVGDPEVARTRCDAHPILDRAGLLLRTGPTDTNVLDLHLLARREP
jgi:glycerate 2-kinase